MAGTANGGLTNNQEQLANRKRTSLVPRPPRKNSDFSMGPGTRLQKNFTEDSDKAPVVCLQLQNGKTAANKLD